MDSNQYRGHQNSYNYQPNYNRSRPSGNNQNFYYNKSSYRGNDVVNTQRQTNRWSNQSNFFPNNEGEQNYGLPGLMKQHIQVKPDQATSITQPFDLNAPCGFCGSAIVRHTIGQCPKRRSPKYHYSTTSSPESATNRSPQ